MSCTPTCDMRSRNRTWSAARLAAARAVVAATSEQWQVPAENLLQPDLLRRLCWSPPVPADESGVRATLEAGGARPWQLDLLVPLLTPTLAVTAS